MNKNKWLYYDYDEENDITYPYNCLIGDSHFWIIDEIENKLIIKEED